MACEFIDSITEKRLPITDGYAGYRVVRLLEAAQRSMSLNGRPIELANTMGPRKSVNSTLAVVA
jgi:hypothetical protein